MRRNDMPSPPRESKTTTAAPPAPVSAPPAPVSAPPPPPANAQGNGVTPRPPGRGVPPVRLPHSPFVAVQLLLTPHVLRLPAAGSSPATPARSTLHARRRRWRARRSLECDCGRRAEEPQESFQAEAQVGRRAGRSAGRSSKEISPRKTDRGSPTGCAGISRARTAANKTTSKTSSKSSRRGDDGTGAAASASLYSGSAQVEGSKRKPASALVDAGALSPRRTRSKKPRTP